MFNLQKNKIMITKIYFITLILIASNFLTSSCNNNSDKKEAAKNYIKEQSINNVPGNTVAAQPQKDSNKKGNKKAVKIMTSSNFSTTISSGVTLVDFWATWCRPCLMQAPIVEEVAVEIGNKATIGKLDVDQAGMIAQQYGIRNIPTILIFKDGEVVERFVGLKDKQSLLNAINKHL